MFDKCRSAQLGSEPAFAEGQEMIAVSRVVAPASETAFLWATRWALRAFRPLYPKSSASLTVLCYHRIGRPELTKFHGYRPNFSATEDQFAEQMRLIRALFTPISIRDLALFIEGRKELPVNPVLVTFDDGYSDNGTAAWPILRYFGIPATVFLTTQCISFGRPFICDWAAFCFEKSGLNQADCPLLGPVYLGDMERRVRLTQAWVAKLKSLPAETWRDVADTLASALEVVPSDETFSSLYLNWDQVRALKGEGLDFGGHTETHPILSRTRTWAAGQEISGCQSVLQQELGEPSLAFAYPNGGAGDFTREHEALTKAAGFRVAFSLNAGSASLTRVRQRPTAVRRIYIGGRDDPVRLAAKLAHHFRCPDEA